MVDLSFVIVSWNAREYLLDCIASILNHCGELSREIIVVDNASSDGSAEAVRSAYPEVTLIQNAANEGFAAANNRGIRKSRGRYLCLVNSDVLLLPGCLERLKEFMDAHSGVGVLGPRILNADRSVQPSTLRLPKIRLAVCRALALDSLFGLGAEPIARGSARGEPREVEALSGCFWLLRREAVDEIGLLDERFFMYFEDLDWCLRFRRAGWQIVYDPGAEAIHFGGASSSKAPIRFLKEFARATLKYWRKHHWLPSLVAVWLLMVLSHALRGASSALVWVASPRRREGAAFTFNRSCSLLAWLLGRSWRMVDRQRAEAIGQRAQVEVNRG